MASFPVDIYNITVHIFCMIATIKGHRRKSRILTLPPVVLLSCPGQVLLIKYLCKCGSSAVGAAGASLLAVGAAAASSLAVGAAGASSLAVRAAGASSLAVGASAASSLAVRVAGASSLAVGAAVASS
jgi:hypothetical protein